MDPAVNLTLAEGVIMGMLALPWLWLLALSLVFVLDVVLCENDAFGWATFLVITGTGLVAWLGGEVNVFAWTWANLADIAEFLLAYFLVGAFWSIAKWYLYLLKVKEKVEAGTWAYGYRERPDASKDAKIRPRETFARNNKARIMGWIAHWPFSAIGALFGDLLNRIVTHIYRVLSGLYDRIANRVFSGYETGGE